MPTSRRNLLPTALLLLALAAPGCSAIGGFFSRPESAPASGPAPQSPAEKFGAVLKDVLPTPVGGIVNDVLVFGTLLATVLGAGKKEQPAPATTTPKVA